ncbi:angiogenic factor with G patch and FHA domains 1-like isoform X1 [Physella acuta]|uniref:angiogenic factor with G patch and FHA domains 1-like isoform X1 n=1 Tax=Physella acuta TaxID=109671 RepID=UPI0027DE4ED2|nr:angiogenic factor with G patch and FHA domains 1-like isoform X1 [Physella acuta]
MVEPPNNTKLLLVENEKNKNDAEANDDDDCDRLSRETMPNKNINKETEVSCELDGDDFSVISQAVQTNSSTENSFNCNSIIELNKIISDKNKEIDRLNKCLAKAERLLERSNSYNEDLRKELSAISSQLHCFKNKIEHLCNSSTQVCAADIDEAYGLKPMPQWEPVSDNTGALSIAESLKAAAEEELKKITSEIPPSNTNRTHTDMKDASGEYVYDATSGFYYHPATGYYWDPNSGLFYDYTTGTYYQFDSETGEYKLYSVVNEPSAHIKTGSSNSEIKGSEFGASSGLKLSKRRRVKQKRHKRRLKSTVSKVVSSVVITVSSGEEDEKQDRVERRNKREKTKAKTDTTADVEQREELTEEITVDDENKDNSSESSGSLATGESELESGELSSDSSDIEMLDVKAEVSASEAGLELSDYQPLEIADNHPPCIRVIVLESESLQMGALHIITCAGGMIGREENKGNVLEIPDKSVSKVHAQVQYDTDNNCYLLSDLGSQNGTILNGNRISKSRDKSCENQLSHGDVLQLGSTKLLLHIHKGYETCEDCEPGLVQAKLKALNPIKNDYKVLSKEEKLLLKKKELKNIKKKYGLQNSNFENPGTKLNDDYCDKAYLRRKFIGSEAEHTRRDELPASVHSPISAENKGHKLLAKMGWKDGQGLGKTNTGISEPVTVEMRLNQSAGLGSASGHTASLDQLHSASKTKRWIHTQQRFQNLEKSGTQLRETTPDAAVGDQGSGDLDSAGSAGDTSGTKMETNSRTVWVSGGKEQLGYP